MEFKGELMFKENYATGELAPSKKRERLVSLDNNHTKKYNYNHKLVHIHHLISGVSFSDRVAALWLTPRNYIQKIFTKSVATRGLITNPAKAGLGSVSLDIRNAKQYNNHNNESCNFHYLLLLGHKLLATRGLDLVAKTPRNYIQKILSKRFLLVILLSFLALSKAFGYYEPNDKSFKDGFEAGLKALEFQAKNEGFTSKNIKISKPFTLLLDIKEMPLSEVLFLQILASREGIESHLSEDFLYLGSFEREIDAKDRIKSLIAKFKLNAKNLKIHKNIQEIITYPYLYKSFYESLLQKAKEQGIIVETKILTKTTIKNPVQKPLVKKVSPIQFTFKNTKAMSYVSLGGVENDSKNYEEKGLKKKQNFTFEKKIKTNLGESFIKVAGENLYFLEADVLMLKTNSKTPCERLCQ